MFRDVTRLTRIVVFCGFVLGCTSFASAALKLPGVIGDNMVLQRGRPIPIWGWTTPGADVTVSLAGHTLTDKAKANGSWRVQFPSMEVGDPLEMVIKDTVGNTLVVNNILVGEVWVCSGQSNMEWVVMSSKNFEQEKAAANYPKVRICRIERLRSRNPISDTLGRWDVASPENAAMFSAIAYFFGRDLHKELNVPVGMINASWGGTLLEWWINRDAVHGKPEYEILTKNNDLGCLYNAMIHPLTPYPIRGVLWYQGEANVGDAYLYRSWFPAMIKGWRKAWNQGDFPFGFAQIAPFSRYGEAPAKGSAAAELREAQLMTLTASPNTGMVVTTDLVDDINDIHPKNKQDVGHRFALWALAKVYGRDNLVYSGPIYKSMTVEGNKIRLQFDHVGGGLVASDGKPLTDFTIAAEDQKFVPAAAEIDGNTIVVHSDEVANPAAVRFGWRRDAMPNFKNKEGLPASPFRTDTWKGVTQ